MIINLRVHTTLELRCAARSSRSLNTHPCCTPAANHSLLKTVAAEKGLPPTREPTYHPRTPAFNGTCLQQTLYEKDACEKWAPKPAKKEGITAAQPLFSGCAQGGKEQRDLQTRNAQHPNDTNMQQHVCALWCAAAKMQSLFMPVAQAHTLPAVSLQGRQQALHSQATLQKENQAFEYVPVIQAHPILHRHAWHTTNRPVVSAHGP
jgi:hypothetical protein